MKKLARFMVKHTGLMTIVGLVVLPVSCVIIGDAVSFPDWLTYTLAAVVVFYWILLTITASTYLLKESLESLNNQCDPYPFLKEMNEQRTYPGNDVVKQIREIDYALALRCVGEYEKAFNAITFVQGHRTDNMIYYPKRVSRDRTAREEYQERRRQFDPIKSTFMIDIIRDKWTNNDERLQ